MSECPREIDFDNGFLSDNLPQVDQFAIQVVSSHRWMYLLLLDPAADSSTLLLN